jgi:hypothetical protein
MILVFLAELDNMVSMVSIVFTGSIVTSSFGADRFAATMIYIYTEKKDKKKRPDKIFYLERVIKILTASSK